MSTSHSPVVTVGPGTQAALNCPAASLSDGGVTITVQCSTVSRRLPQPLALADSCRGQPDATSVTVPSGCRPQPQARDLAATDSDGETVTSHCTVFTASAAMMAS